MESAQSLTRELPCEAKNAIEFSGVFKGGSYEEGKSQ